jgi:hypothetical protein
MPNQSTRLVLNGTGQHENHRTRKPLYGYRTVGSNSRVIQMRSIDRARKPSLAVRGNSAIVIGAPARLLVPPDGPCFVGGELAFKEPPGRGETARANSDVSRRVLYRDSGGDPINVFPIRLQVRHLRPRRLFRFEAACPFERVPERIRRVLSKGRTFCDISRPRRRGKTKLDRRSLRDVEVKSVLIDVNVRHEDVKIQRRSWQVKLDSLRRAWLRRLSHIECILGGGSGRTS